MEVLHLYGTDLFLTTIWITVHHLRTRFNVFKGCQEERQEKQRRKNERIIKCENWELNWSAVYLSPKSLRCCNENGRPDAYGGRLFPITTLLWKKTSLFLKVIVAVIRERVLLRVTAEGLRGSGWLDNLVPIPASLPSAWASPPLGCPACLLVWTQSAGWNYLPAPGKLNMISDLSILCPTVTFADPPTLRDYHNEWGTKWRVCVWIYGCFFLKGEVRMCF